MSLRYRNILHSLKKYLPETQAIIDRAVSEGFTLPSSLSYINTLISVMITDGYWAKRDLILNFAYNNINCQDFSRINWKNPLGALMTRTGFTNLWPTSEIFNSGWTKVGALVTDNATTAPDTTMTAAKYWGTTSTSRIQRSATTMLRNTINVPMTFSIYAKADVLTKLILVNSLSTATYDLITGVVTLNSGIATVGMTDEGSGWWRCSITEDWTGASFFQIQTNPRFQGTDDGIFIWGAQLNEGTTPLTYVKTTASTNTGTIIYNQNGWVGYQTPNPNTFLDTNFNLIADSPQYTTTNAGRDVIVQENGFSNSMLDGNTAGLGESLRAGNLTSQRIVSTTNNLNTAVNMVGTGYRGINRTSATGVELFTGATQFSRTQSNAQGISTGSQTIHNGQNTIGGSANISYYSVGAEVVTEGQLFRTAYDNYLTNIGLTPIA